MFEYDLCNIFQYNLYQMRRCWPPDQRLQVPAAGRGLEQVFGRQGARRYDPTYLSTSVYIYISVCLSIYQSIYLSLYIYLSIYHLSIYLSIYYLSTFYQASNRIYQSYQPINLSILSTYQSINLIYLINLSIYPSIHLPSIHPSAYPSIHRSHQSINLINLINPSILSILSTH